MLLIKSQVVCHLPSFTQNDLCPQYEAFTIIVVTIQLLCDYTQVHVTDVAFFLIDVSAGFKCFECE